MTGTVSNHPGALRVEMFRSRWIVLAFLLGVPFFPSAGIASESTTNRWREPIGLWCSADERVLVIALRKSRELIVLDLATGTVVDRMSALGCLEGLAGSERGVLLAVDGENDAALVVRESEGRLSLLGRFGTGSGPMQCAVDSSGRFGYVATRLGKAVECYDLASGECRFRTALPFEPHCLALGKERGCLLVADAFRARVAGLDSSTGALLATRVYPGTNIRGLAISPDGRTLHFTHQILTEKSMITRDAIFWGALFTNNLRSVSLAEFWGPKGSGDDWSELGYLGDSRRGAGDPGAMDVATDGTMVICLSGVDELAIQRRGSISLERVRVGTRPVAVCLSPTGNRAYVACAGDDAVAVVDLNPRPVVSWIALGPPATLSPAERGELLFASARLSLDGWFSCQSCHTDGHTNGLNADTDGDGNYGAPKNTPSLLGVADSAPWGWTGRFDTLEEQIKTSMVSTLHGNFPSKEQIADLAAYLRTLRPRQTPVSDPSLVEEGGKIFRARGCVECHVGDAATSGGVFDVGLDDGLGGHHRFNPPSLRGVGRTAPYLHDGRAESLEELFREVGHPDGDRLPDAEIAPLIEYLRSL